MKPALANMHHRMPVAQHPPAGDLADDQLMVARRAATHHAALQVGEGVGQDRCGATRLGRCTSGLTMTPGWFGSLIGALLNNETRPCEYAPSDARRPAPARRRPGR